MQFDFSQLSPAHCYKIMSSTIVPRPIAWVVTQSLYSFFNAISGDPPIVAVGIGGRETGGGPKDSTGNIRRTGQFVVNMVRHDLARPMNITAVEFEPGVSEILEAGLHTAPSILVAPPRIAESPVALECEVFQIINLPDERDIILGVLDAARCHIDTPKLDLIGRLHGGGWYTRTRDRFEMPRIPLEDYNKAAGGAD